MKLSKKQREFLLALISEGLESDEINRRASEFAPPFAVSRQQVDHYRRTRGQKIKEMIERGEDGALTSGLALRSERVSALKELAACLREDALKRWLPRTKMIGSGDYQTLVEYEEYNAAAVSQYMAAISEIAAEMGDRKQKVEHTGKDGEDLTLNIVIDPTPVKK